MLEDCGPKTADKAADGAAASAGQTWEDNQKNLPATQAAVDARYADYKEASSPNASYRATKRTHWRDYFFDFGNLSWDF